MSQDDQKAIPAGTTLNQSELLQRSVNLLLNNIHLFLHNSGQDSAYTDVDRFSEMTRVIHEELGKVAEMAIANRVNLEDAVTLKTKTTVVADPDQCDLNIAGVTYELSYNLIKQGPDGKTQTRNYTQEEAIAAFGEKQFDRFWGIADKGTHKIEQGEDTYWFTVERSPVRKTFDMEITQEADHVQGIQEKMAAHQRETQQMETQQAQAPKQGQTQQMG